MRLVEKHVIKRSHPDWHLIDNLAYKAKNLYNASLYDVRQHYFKTGKTKHANQVIKDFTADSNPDYTALPRKLSQQVARRVGDSFSSFFALLGLKKKGKYDAQVSIPGYLAKNGRTVVSIPRDAISRKPKVVQTKRGKLYEFTICSQDLGIKFRSRHSEIQAARLIPKIDHYVLEVIWEKAEPEALVEDNGRYAAIDLGVNNLAAVFYGFERRPELVSGKAIKSANQWYNKERARLQSELPEGVKTSNKIRGLTRRRNHKVDDALHRTSSAIVANLIEAGVAKLAIGLNPGWKTEVELGKRNNQSFVMIPHSRLASMLAYKCRLEGIEVILTEESYTSKSSFLDLDALPVYGEEVGEPSFSGRRVKRGLYKSGSGTLLNADVNGAANIYRKVFPMEVIPEGVGAVVVQPVRLGEGPRVHEKAGLS